MRYRHIVAVADSLMASAAYYISSAADQPNRRAEPPSAEGRASRASGRGRILPRKDVGVLRSAIGGAHNWRRDVSYILDSQ